MSKEKFASEKKLKIDERLFVYKVIRFMSLGGKGRKIENKNSKNGERKRKKDRERAREKERMDDILIQNCSPPLTHLCIIFTIIVYVRKREGIRFSEKGKRERELDRER